MEQNKTFQRYEEAREYIHSQGFNPFRGTPISMGDGYEHIIIMEFHHPTEPLVCRYADLRSSQRKNCASHFNIIDFIQVTIKNKN